MLTCPFCGAPESERIAIEGRRFLVFGCMFTPEVDPTLSDAEVEERLRSAFGPQGAGYFRKTCDALHVYVAKGEGARILTGGRGSSGSGPAGEGHVTDR
jgi:hypothetical protein